MLEQVVRPYQTSDTIVSRPIVAKLRKKARTRPRVIWGAVGTLPAVDKEDDGTDPQLYSFKLESCNDTYKESKREVTPIRITSANNSDNYVDFNRIKLISFAHQTDSKILGSFSSETTAFADTAISDSSTFGTVKAGDKCKATYNLTS